MFIQRLTGEIYSKPQAWINFGTKKKPINREINAFSHTKMVIVSRSAFGSEVVLGSGVGVRKGVGVKVGSNDNSVFELCIGVE